MAEPEQKDIKRNYESLVALYRQHGENVFSFIMSVAESLAYQQATTREYRKLHVDALTDIRRMERLNKEKAEGLNPNA